MPRQENRLPDKAVKPRPLGRGYKALNVLLTITQSRLNLLKLFFQVFLCQQDVNPKVLPIRVNPKWRTSTQTETVLRLLPFCV